MIADTGTTFVSGRTLRRLKKEERLAKGETSKAHSHIVLDDFDEVDDVNDIADGTRDRHL